MKTDETAEPVLNGKLGAKLQARRIEIKDGGMKGDWFGTRRKGRRGVGGVGRE